MKKALIFGLAGMDGSHLADLLLKKGYMVYGVLRGDATQSRENIQHLKGNSMMIFLTGDLMDQDSLLACLQESQPDEVYNLAGQSSVAESWKSPQYNANVNGIGALLLLGAIRAYKVPVRLFQASTSEMFGKTAPGTLKCTEITPHHPRSPYAAAKSFAHSMVVLYREAYGMFNCCGIFYNHESERRGLNFLTRKITHNVAKISLGLNHSDSFSLGNIDICKDWGYAPDYMQAAWMMLQHDTPDDYIIATEKVNSVEFFLRTAFKHIGIENWNQYVKQDPALFRPIEFDFVPGDCSKIKEKLNWQPETNLTQMIKKMVDNDIELQIKSY